MILLAAIVLAGQKPKVNEEQRYIQPANYYVSQIPLRGKADRWAPHPAADIPEQALRVMLSPKAGGLNIRIVNGSKDRFFDAQDGSLSAYLQAEDRKGAWQPIEYLFWASCGNSCERIPLPSGYEWTFQTALPAGRFKTKARLVYSVDGVRHYSRQVEVLIPMERFTQTAKMAKKRWIAVRDGLALAYPPNSTRAKNARILGVNDHATE